MRLAPKVSVAVGRNMKKTSLGKAVEQRLFAHRATFLWIVAAFTVCMLVYALQLRMSAGFDKQIPIGHPYSETYNKYKNDLFDPNRLTVVVHARNGTMWTEPALRRLYDVTQAVEYLPHVDRGGVQSLWTPNVFVNEITEDGFRAEPVIAGTVTPRALAPSVLNSIRQSAARGGYIGTLVSRDESSAMVVATFSDRDASGSALDYIALNHVIEKQIREKFEDQEFEIQVIGFAKQIGDIADGASGVLGFCLVSLGLTMAAVYWYCRSVRFTLLVVGCSLASLVWQFGTLQILGFGLDPLGVLVPFLVFAIGVSHGIQQINFILRELSLGATTFDAARHSFRGLLIPGTLALVTALTSFLTLMFIPIPMVRELAITASLGVGYKIITNLVMLPVAASYCTFSNAYAANLLKAREKRGRFLRVLATVARPKQALLVTVASCVLLAVSVVKSEGRVIGALQPGAPELRSDARFNRDAAAIAAGFDVGLDWLSVVVEAPRDSCSDPRLGLYVNDFSDAIAGTPGVSSVSSYASMLRTYSEGYNEGFPKMAVIPVDPANYGALTAEIARVKGYVNKDCSMAAIHIFLTDHNAKTIKTVLEATRQYVEQHPGSIFKIRLAAGNAGVMAATNDEIERTELPMMLYVYAAILSLVFLAYRDIRAMIACCLPLTIATFIGYWFMKDLHIGLTVATLPVMVLAVGIGVDYAFYIYNRLQAYLAQGLEISAAVERALSDVGIATIFTALTLAAGVCTWAFSPLKFQADMGKLLAFMFLMNLVMAMTALPAMAVVLDRVFPRSRPVKTSSILSH